MTINFLFTLKNSNFYLAEWRMSYVKVIYARRKLDGFMYENLRLIGEYFSE